MVYFFLDVKADPVSFLFSGYGLLITAALVGLAALVGIFVYRRRKQKK